MKNIYSNSFDLIRHFAAILVLFSHHYALSGIKEPSFLKLGSYGFLGVVIFFTISGFLITQSFLRSESYISYMERRIKRIFPALIVCSIITCLVICPLFYTKGITEYFLNASSYRMIFDGSMLLGLKNKHVFEDFIFPSVVNSSLWTLPYEFLFYLTVGAALTISKRHITPLIILIIAIVGMIYIKNNETNIQIYAIRLDRIFKLLLFFSIGSLLALTERDWNKKNVKIFFIATAILIFSFQSNRNDFYIVGNIFLAIVIIIIGVSFTENIISGRYDISYGIYIYAFPIQQIIINESGLGFYPSMIASLLITILAATLSWHFIEKKYLKKSNHRTFSQG